MFAGQAIWNFSSIRQNLKNKDKNIEIWPETHSDKQKKFPPDEFSRKKIKSNYWNKNMEISGFLFRDRNAQKRMSRDYLQLKKGDAIIQAKQAKSSINQ